MPTAEIKRVWDRIIEIGPHPIVGLRQDLTIHHCHGGSLNEIGIHRAMGKKPSDWLTICLPAHFHVGQKGIDSGYGVLKWERDYTTQVALLTWTSRKLQINLFRKAGYDVRIKGEFSWPRQL